MLNDNFFFKKDVICLLFNQWCILINSSSSFVILSTCSVLNDKLFLKEDIRGYVAIQ